MGKAIGGVRVTRLFMLRLLSQAGSAYFASDRAASSAVS